MVKEKRAVKLTISGKVQGVGFRFFVKENAQSLGIKGYVKNLPDGEVEAFFQGSKENVNKMIEMCKKGPLTAEVEDIKVEEKEPQNYENFKVTG